jgi:protoporphyrinogen oxidase
VIDPGPILILGAGPTGLGAAYRLQERGVGDFTVIEAREQPGGLASSYVDSRGFTWDVGGHVQFSHYAYYDDLLDRAVDRWLYHERESWVWIKGRFVPYPFQNNIHRLAAGDRRRALDGLERAAAARGERRPENFGEWIRWTFGEGIAELFLEPYNFKVWGYLPATLGIGWMGDRVAVPDLERIKQNVRDGRDDVSWGPNNRFRFPLRGGTGAIWHGVAKLIDAGRFRYGRAVRRIDLERRRVELADGETLAYGALVSSLPLTALAAMCEGLDPGARRAAAALVYSSVHILGIGLRGGKPDELGKKCWIYFPDPASPYYRVTVFSNYSPHNVPDGEGHWSLMAEVCESPVKPVDRAVLPDAVLRAMRADRLVPPGAEVVSVWHRREEHGYPTPFLGRDAALAAIRAALERHRVYSRGRFGAWQYEVSNQDHSSMQGVEVVDRILGIDEEVTIRYPDRVNGGAFLKR